MQSFNLIEMWRNMALLAKGVNVLLAICSIYSLWVIIDRFVALRSVKSKSMKFVGNLRDQLKFRNIDGAMQLSTQMNDNPMARLVRDSLIEYREGTDMLRARGPHDHADYDPVEAVERVVDRVKEREVADLKRGLGGLASISSAAPFIGLFGTVVGIINAFRAMAQTGQGGLGAVSAGISEALFTTAVGLLVAIPAVMTFNYFSTVIERFVVDMNGVGSELVSFILREGVAPPQVHQNGVPASLPPQGLVQQNAPSLAPPPPPPPPGAGYPPPGYPNR